MGNPQHCSLGTAIGGTGTTTGGDVTQVSYGQPYIMGLPDLDLCPYFDVRGGGRRRLAEKGHLAITGPDGADRKLWTPTPTNQQLAQRCHLTMLKTTEPGTCKVKFGPEHLPMLTDTPLVDEEEQLIEIAGGNFITGGGASRAEFGPCPTSTKCPCTEGQMFEPGCHESAICNTTAWDGSADVSDELTIEEASSTGTGISTVERVATGDNMMELLFQTNVTVKVVDDEKPMIGCRAGVPLKLPVQGNCKTTFKPADYIPAMDNCGNAKTFCINKFPGQTCANKAAIDPHMGMRYEQQYFLNDICVRKRARVPNGTLHQRHSEG